LRVDESCDAQRHCSEYDESHDRFDDSFGGRESRRVGATKSSDWVTSAERRRAECYHRCVQHAATPPTFDAELDARGLVCPEPLMLVRNRLRKMQTGEVLFVIATDPSTLRDFTSLCRFMGHRLLAHDCDDGVWRFWIERA
jgi:tRNA 2-thiouridine synthesizing protein A